MGITEDDNTKLLKELEAIDSNVRKVYSAVNKVDAKVDADHWAKSRGAINSCLDYMSYIQKELADPRNNSFVNDNRLNDNLERANEHLETAKS